MELAKRFIRQQWRMWIETPFPCHMRGLYQDSFASNGECGLKLICAQKHLYNPTKFIRQQWRMWIETSPSRRTTNLPPDSFASNGECGLKHACEMLASTACTIHSPAMANVD